MCDRFVSVWRLWTVTTYLVYRLFGREEQEGDEWGCISLLLRELYNVPCFTLCNSSSRVRCSPQNRIFSRHFLTKYCLKVIWMLFHWVFVNKVAYKAGEGGVFIMQQWSNYIIVSRGLPSIPLSLPSHLPPAFLPTSLPSLLSCVFPLEVGHHS